MIDRTGMTIEAYLRQAGIKYRISGSAQPVIPLEDTSKASFDALLQAARSTSKPGTNNGHRKRTISDYLIACKGPATVPPSFNRLPQSAGALKGRAMPLENPGPCLPSKHLQRSLEENRPEAVSPQVHRHEDTHIRADILQGIRNAAKKHAVSEKLIQSVIQAESGYRPQAVSPAGAQGLMQLMPATARELGVSDPFDIEQNIDAGARYLRKMIDRFNGDIKLALAAYNAGPGTVERYNGNVPYQETQTYIQRVLSTMAALDGTIG